MYPDNHKKKNKRDISDICKVKNPKSIHLVAPLTVLPSPGTCTKRDNIIARIKKYCP